MKCPRCDYPRQPEERECSNCGIDFNYVEKKMARSPVTAAPAPLEDNVPVKPTPPPEVEVIETPVAADTALSQASVEDENKPCPKCGFHNQVKALECLRCGIIFDKYEVYLEKRRKAEEETNQTTDGLLDPETIQMAAEASRQTQPSPVYAKTACPHCGQRYKIRNDQVGITTRCKKCSSIFKIEALPTIEP
ncbi:MAG: hypothetical protein JJV98_18960 [Desulfosarcina sp.]|nr:hypothetical protein [Desulfobacterales bacterium]